MDLSGLLLTLNEFVAYSYFNMETIHYSLQLLKPGCFMALIDWKDAYFSVPIAQEHRKYWCFLWQNKVY